MIHRSEKTIWLTLLAMELTYVLLARVVVSNFGMYTLDAEYFRTPARLLLVVVYWVLFRDLLTSKKLTPQQVSQPPFLVALVLLMSVPLLVGDLSYMSPTTKSVYAAGSLIVGLREEFLFRGLIQNLLSRRIGDRAAILFTTFVFALWHVGVIPPLLFSYVQVIVAGLLLGTIYAKTRNLWFVVAIHTVYDALWSFTPIFDGPIIPYRYGIVLLCLSLAGVVWWGRQTWSPKSAVNPDLAHKAAQGRLP